MANDYQLVIRIPVELQERLSDYVERLSREFGLPISMAAGARRLLAEGLERAGLPQAERTTVTTARRKQAAKKKRTQRKS